MTGIIRLLWQLHVFEHMIVFWSYLFFFFQDKLKNMYRTTNINVFLISTVVHYCNHISEVTPKFTSFISLCLQAVTVMYCRSAQVCLVCPLSATVPDRVHFVRSWLKQQSEKSRPSGWLLSHRTLQWPPVQSHNSGAETPENSKNK